MAAAAPFALKALPFIAKGGAALGSMLLGKKVSGPSKEQSAGLSGAQGSIDALQSYSAPLIQQGSALTKQGGEGLGAATKYYSGVLGNRQQAREAVSPEINSLMDFYKGSDRKIGRTLRGGSRDYAMAESARQRVGQTASLIPAARRDAAANMGQLGASTVGAGSSIIGTGVGAATSAANASNQLYNMASQQQQQQREGGKGIGNFIYDILGSGMGGGGGTKAPLPSKSFDPRLFMNAAPSVGR